MEVLITNGSNPLLVPNKAPKNMKAVIGHDADTLYIKLLDTDLASDSGSDSSDIKMTHSDFADMLDDAGAAHYALVQEQGRDHTCGPPAAWFPKGSIEFVVEHAEMISEGIYDTIDQWNTELKGMTLKEIGAKYVHMFRKKRAYADKNKSEVNAIKLMISLEEKEDTSMHAMQEAGGKLNAGPAPRGALAKEMQKYISK
jgi:hypothetical protein